jgi:hypothetical protein
MSQVALSGNALGTGTFTIASPNSNTNRTLNLPDASGTILTDSGGQAASFSALTVNGNNISAVNSLGFRNRVINGNMVIDQRNAGAAVTPVFGTTSFPVDRWQGTISANSKFSAQQNAGAVTPPAGFTKYLGATSLSAYSVGSGDYFALQQNIEGFNVADLGWGAGGAQSVTLSFWVRSSLTGTFGGGLKNNAANRTYPFTYTISAANTWEYKTITIAGDTSGTWTTDNTTGLAVMFGLGVGSTFSGTAGSWAGANLVSATGAVSVVGTNGATFYITGVQLEAGSVATPFEQIDYGRELIMCQRYYETGQVGAVSYAASGSAIQRSALFYKVTKRAVPTLGLTYLVGTSQTATPDAQYAESAWLGWPSFTGSGQATVNTFTASAEL